MQSQHVRSEVGHGRPTKTTREERCHSGLDALSCGVHRVVRGQVFVGRRGSWLQNRMGSGPFKIVMLSDMTRKQGHSVVDLK